MAFGLDGAESVVDIKVIGVGGGGSNVVNRMVESGVKGVEFIAVNTDKQALAISSANHKIQIGGTADRGPGRRLQPRGGPPVRGGEPHADLQGPGGRGYGVHHRRHGRRHRYGAAPILADLSKEMDILTVGVVTKPFPLKGRRRMEQAEKGIENLRTKVDSLVIIPNERLKFATDQKITLANAFEVADDVLRQAVQSISDLIQEHRLYQSGLCRRDRRDAERGYGPHGRGPGRRKEQGGGGRQDGCLQPLLETSINGARGVLVNVTGSTDVGDWRRWRPRPTWCSRPPTPTHLLSSAPLLTTRWRTRSGSPSSPPALMRPL